MQIAILICLLFLVFSMAKADAVLASWYGEDHRGKPMANRKPFNPDALTAASWFFPLGSKVEVAHAGKSVVVEICDRGPSRRLLQQGRKIDLSLAAFSRLANPKVGLINVTIREVK